MLIIKYYYRLPKIRRRGEGERKRCGRVEWGEGEVKRGKGKARKRVRGKRKGRGDIFLLFPKVVVTLELILSKRSKQGLL